MAETSAIEWTDATFNPWIGCTKVSMAATGGGGCDNCYAAVSTPARAMRIAWGAGQPRHRTSPETWGQPKRWNDAHAEFFAMHGRRRRVFCASLADVFDNEVDAQWRVDLFALMRRTPNLDWLLLTKRIGNVQRLILEARDQLTRSQNVDLWMWLDAWIHGVPPRNVWLGATVVNQDEVDRDIPKLLATPAHVRFLSMEPLLGPVEFSKVGRRADALSQLGKKALSGVDWVIVGGESGPGARPMHPTWAQSLRDQCAAVGVPFLFKQHGEWTDNTCADNVDRLRWVAADGSGALAFNSEASVRAFNAALAGTAVTDYRLVERVGKKAAGRMLDGRTHDGFPVKDAA